MCIGVPLQVLHTLPSGAAMCADPGEPATARPVETLLLDTAPAPGDWLLVHVDMAIRPISALEAGRIGDALRAVTAAAAGAPFEHLLADLIDREPQLPPHLRAAQPAEVDNDQYGD